jgi:hypothetical protein
MSAPQTFEKKAAVCSYSSLFAVGAIIPESEVRQITKQWTAEEDERLRDLAEKGASAQRVSAALNRSAISVTQRARKLGCPLPSTKATRKKLVGDRM